MHVSIGINTLRLSKPQVYGRRRPKFYVAAGFLEALHHQTVPHDGVEGSGIYVREMLAAAPRHSRSP
eukprot:scaffold319294_cov17-Tisochrysis_lutea.AAC.1